MLSAQQHDFDDKKKDRSPYPRDFTRWYALDYFLRPSRFKSRRFYVTFSAALAVLLLSLGSMFPGLHRIHQAAPLSKAHAMFNRDCATCHDQSLQPIMRLFGAGNAPSVSDAACNKCHEGTIHHAKQAHEPSCVSCHREHRGHEGLAAHVADRQCTACHRNLSNHMKLGEISTFHSAITHFNRHHPEFRVSSKGNVDPSKIKFSHKSHLDLDIDALRQANEKVGRADLSGLTGAMKCADCHQMDEERKYLKAIQYDKHCSTCHALNIGLAGDFAPGLKAAAAAFGKMPLPHKEPAIVRAVLRDRLVQFAQQHAIVGNKVHVKPRIALPWKPGQIVTDEQWSWASERAKKTEAILFLNQQSAKTHALTTCSHCHIEAGRADGLPIYEKSLIPSRWQQHSVFNHGSHRNVGCTDCHDKNEQGVSVADSRSASDILLPTLQKCQECHTGAGGARNTCVECHRYHSR
jgi:NAD-dependent SIR2 family protein deacetylase